MPNDKYCAFCGAELSEKEVFCPKCGTYDQSETEPQDRFTVIRPRSIEELKVYCGEHGIPCSRIGFFVDEDVVEPFANGIYRDGARVIVYENSPNGFRNIGYMGESEEAAVELFFPHLIDQCHEFGIHPERMKGLSDPAVAEAVSGRQHLPDRGRGRRVAAARIVAVILAAAAVLALIVLLLIHSRDGYYSGAGGLYYKAGSKWYYHNGTSWTPTETPEDDYMGDFLGRSYDPSWGGESFYLPEDIMEVTVTPEQAPDGGDTDELPNEIPDANGGDGN